MHTVATPSGRIVTFRLVSPIADDDGLLAAAEVRSAILGLEGSVVVVNDLRGAQTFSPSVASGFVSMMKADNPKIERSALVLSPTASTLRLQIQRMLREAGSANRAVFDDESDAMAWLLPGLDVAERSAVGAFLGTTAAFPWSNATR